MKAGTESRHDRVMQDSITISKTLSIRECGYDEYWLQDQVFANPIIQLLSLTIPIMAIQANIIEANGKRILHFTKILDTEMRASSFQRKDAKTQSCEDSKFPGDSAPL